MVEKNLQICGMWEEFQNTVLTILDIKNLTGEKPYKCNECEESIQCQYKYNQKLKKP